ncbi:MAG: hypothetical protein JRG90_10720 [Deltaproteobacteria bacterium]|nr:hypothetical protein [Deltaproteobacteria bacterium]
MSLVTTRRNLLAVGASLIALIALALYGSWPLLGCVDSCFIDYFAIHDAQTAHFEMPDTRLNSWILAWVQHALFESPTTLFDTNVFYPASNTLAGSEHLLGVALQTLPFRLFSDGAVMLHQSALILSFALLAINTFFFVRWAAGSTWGALLAGAAAAFMPWRFSELGHLQLLSVQWIPLIWMLAGRVLAYLTLLSTGVIVLTLWIATRPEFRAVLRLAGAVALPTAIVALTSIPYISRFSAFRFAENSTTDFVSMPGLFLSFLKPPLALRADLAGLAPVTYHLPLVVLAFAALALGWWFAAPRSAPDTLRRRTRVLTAALLVACATAMVLMLGRRIELSGTTILLPGHWLAQFVPGYSQMRAEFRWGIVIGLAGPALAGIGIAWLENQLRALPQATARILALGSARAVTLALFALNICWFQLPSRDAWVDAKDVLRAHQALAKLEPGVTVEIPWRIHRISTASNGSRYMIGSSLHWNPILNGYTAYVPPSYHFLQRLAQSLPDPTAIEKLQRLTGLRWIVVHPERLGRVQKQLWAAAEKGGQLQAIKATPTYRIYEIPTSAWNDSWRAALLADAPGPTTMTGLPRTAIAAPESPPPLNVRVRDQMRYEHGSGLPYFATVTIVNPSAESWPGLDIQPEGLVELRYRFFDAADALLSEGTASLDRDIPHGSGVAAQALVRPPAVDGPMTIHFDLVQRVGGELRNLGFPAVEVAVEVSKRPLLHGIRKENK